MFNLSLFTPFKKDILEDQTLFPALLTDPLQVDDLIQKESINQRFRLFSLLVWTRIFITVIAFIGFLYSGKYTAYILIIIGSYALIIFGLQQLARKNKEKTHRFSFLIGCLDIILLAYLVLLSESSIEMGFLFFSVILSAMLLPLIPLLIIIALALGVIFIEWSQLSLPMFLPLLSGEIGNFIETINLLISYSKSDRFIVLIIGITSLALIVNQLAHWSSKNEVKAQFRYKQMRQVLAFNASVIEHLKSGVLVIGADGKIISINRRALELLNLSSAQPITELKELSAGLTDRFLYWMSSGLEDKKTYRHNSSAQEVSVSFSGFGELEQKNIVMMTLESTNDALLQSHEAKLAALGRLTAGIAHEIRNPLSAINSAAQLLNESSKELPHQKLSQLILKNVNRTDQIISDILSLFQKTDSQRGLLPIYQSLVDFSKEFRLSHKDIPFKLRIIGDKDTPLFFQFDLGQFEQILWNLSSNSLRHAKADPLNISLKFQLSPSRKNIIIDFMDNGVGIEADKVNQIFEPFYSGGNSGSGLGLYLVRELCGANQASIVYLPQHSHHENQSGHLSTNDDSEIRPQPPGVHFRLTVQAYFSKNIKPKFD